MLGVQLKRLNDFIENSQACTSDDEQRRGVMQLYYFPSPNPQKVAFALKELGVDCEVVSVDLGKGEHRQAAFLTRNPFGRVPVLVDDGLTLPESHAILSYLGEKTGRLWPSSAAGRADALRWLFFLSQHIMPPAGDVALRFRSKFFGRAIDDATEAAIKRGEEALPAPLAILEDRLAQNKWMMGAEFGLVDCAYCPVLNVIEKSGFSFTKYPRVQAYLGTCRVRPAWEQTPRLPGL
jgi:glutathione S-transferase